MCTQYLSLLLEDDRVMVNTVTSQLLSVHCKYLSLLEKDDRVMVNTVTSQLLSVHCTVSTWACLWNMTGSTFPPVSHHLKMLQPNQIKKLIFNVYLLSKVSFTALSPYYNLILNFCFNTNIREIEAIFKTLQSEAFVEREKKFGVQISWHCL